MSMAWKCRVMSERRMSGGAGKKEKTKTKPSPSMQRLMSRNIVDSNDVARSQSARLQNARICRLVQVWSVKPPENAAESFGNSEGSIFWNLNHPGHGWRYDHLKVLQSKKHSQFISVVGLIMFDQLCKPFLNWVVVCCLFVGSPAGIFHVYLSGLRNLACVSCSKLITFPRLNQVLAGIKANKFLAPSELSVTVTVDQRILVSLQGIFCQISRQHPTRKATRYCFSPPQIVYLFEPAWRPVLTSNNPGLGLRHKSPVWDMTWWVYAGRVLGDQPIARTLDVQLGDKVAKSVPSRMGARKLDLTLTTGLHFSKTI